MGFDVGRSSGFVQSWQDVYNEQTGKKNLKAGKKYTTKGLSFLLYSGEAAKDLVFIDTAGTNSPILKCRHAMLCLY
jgi:hypothetical protein